MAELREPDLREEDRRGHGTGPRSPEGKERSSQNAIKHGLRAKRKILADESEEEYEALRESWMKEYGDESPMTGDLLEELVDDHWLLKRANRRLFEAEAQHDDADPDPRNWTEEQHKFTQLMMRYRTTAKRDFARSWRALEQLRGTRRREALQDERHLKQVEQRVEKQCQQGLQAEKKEARRIAKERIDAEAAVLPIAQKEDASAKRTAKAGAELSTADKLFNGQNSAKKQKKIYLLEQWVEVADEEGHTVTRLYPSNKNLIERGKTMWPGPDLVYRRINFPNGVPAEYDWTGVDENRRVYGGCGIQRMTPDTWLEVIAREAPEVAKEGYQSSMAPGHIGPTGVGNLPRPKERGGCECSVCVRNQGILDGGEMG